MAHDKSAHEWGSTYEFNGTSYRECSDPECSGHQEWICLLDRWSDTFVTPSPRQRDEAPVEPAREEPADRYQ